MYRGELKKKKKKNFEKYGRQNSSRPSLAHPAGGQETTFYLRVAWVDFGVIVVLLRLQVKTVKMKG